MALLIVRVCSIDVAKEYKVHAVEYALELQEKDAADAAAALQLKVDAEVAAALVMKDKDDADAAAALKLKVDA